MSMCDNNNMGRGDCNHHSSFVDREFYYERLLLNLIKNENLEGIKWLLLSQKANPNVLLPDQGISAMHLLAGMENEYFSVEVMYLALQECCGDPNVQSVEGLTPVHLAAIWGRCKVLEILLNFGGDPNLVEHNTSLNAEDLALREHQWQAYAVLATFTVMNENDVGTESTVGNNLFMEKGMDVEVPFYYDCNRKYMGYKIDKQNISPRNVEPRQTKATQTVHCCQEGNTKSFNEMQNTLEPKYSDKNEVKTLRNSSSESSNKLDNSTENGNFLKQKIKKNFSITKLVRFLFKKSRSHKEKF